MELWVQSYCLLKSTFWSKFVLECLCVSMSYLCMGVCYSCRPSNWHKAGSVCPLGCWNVHFGQQAASVLLNRSCPSYCTSRTMSFSLSVCLSLWVILSLWPYTDSVFDERSDESDSDWSRAVYQSPAHAASAAERSRGQALVSLCFWVQAGLVMQRLAQVIAEGELSALGLPSECFGNVCMRVKRRRCSQGVMGVPLAFNSHDLTGTTG